MRDFAFRVWQGLITIGYWGSLGAGALIASFVTNDPVVWLIVWLCSILFAAVVMAPGAVLYWLDERRRRRQPDWV